MSELENSGWEIFNSRHNGIRSWSYDRRKREATGQRIQHVEGRTEFPYGPSGDFIEDIVNDYFVPDDTKIMERLEDVVKRLEQLETKERP